MRGGSYFGKKSFVSSQGLRLKQKIGQFYEDVFVQGIDPINGFAFDFLLLTPNTPALQSCLEGLQGQAWTKSLPQLRRLFKHCVDALKQPDPARAHALLTLAHVLQAVFAKRLPTQGADTLYAVWGLEQGDEVFQTLMKQIMRILREVAPTEVKDSALRVLLALASAAKVHTNPLLDFFSFHDVFASLLRVLQTNDPKTLPKPVLIKVAFLVLVLAHRHKFDRRNPHLDKLATLDAADTRRVAAVVSELFSFGEYLSNEALAQGSEPLLALDGFDEESWLGWLVLRAGGAFGLAGGASSAARQAAAQGVNERAWQSIPQRALYTFSQTVHCQAALLLYTMLAHTRKFAIRTARLRREVVPANRHRAATTRVLPTECPQWLISLLKGASACLSDHANPRSLLLARLYLVILRLCSEDPACNIILHSLPSGDNLVSVQPFSLWTRAKPQHSLPRSLTASVASLFTSSTEGVTTFPARSEEVVDLSRPFICAVFSLLTEFMRIHVHRLMYLSPLHVSCFNLALQILYRHMSFQRQFDASRAQQGAFGGAPKGTAKHVALQYLSVSVVLLRILSEAGRVDAGTPAGARSWILFLPIVFQASRLLRLLLSLRHEVFAVEGEDFSAQFVYDLARNAGHLEGFFKQARRIPGASDLCHEVEEVVEVAVAFASKVEERMGPELLRLSANEVLDLIVKHDARIDLPRARISGRFKRYVENPGSTRGEVAFFDCLINDVVGDIRSTYLDSNFDAYYVVNSKELEWLRVSSSEKRWEEEKSEEEEEQKKESPRNGEEADKESKQTES